MSPPNGMIGIMIGLVAGFTGLVIWVSFQNLIFSIVAGVIILALLFTGFLYLVAKQHD